MNWYNNLRIKSKLIISFSIVTVFAIVLAVLAVVTLNRIDGSYSYLLNFPQKRFEFLMQISKYCSDMRISTTVIALNQNDTVMIDKYWKQFEESYNDTIVAIDKYLENNNSDTVKELSLRNENTDAVQNFKKQFETYKKHVESGVMYARTGNFEAMNSAFLTGGTIITDIGNMVTDLASEASAYTSETSDINTDKKDSAEMLLFGLIICAIMISSVIVLYTSNLISKPLTLLTAYMLRVGTTGDITLKSDDIKNIEKYSKSTDEIGQCISHTSNFAIRVLEVGDKLKAISDGDLTVEPTLLSQDDVMGCSLKKMIDNLNYLFIELKTASNLVSTGSSQVSQAAQSLAAGTSEQSASIEEFTASLAELQERTNYNAGNSAKAREANNKAETKLGDSISSMNEMLEAMKAIDESSTNITKVIKVIDDIAFQTNILALNAAVEAARAGEHGKGFAIVANEVRNLASKSASAAKETAILIEGSSERVREGNQIVAKTNADLADVAEDSRESSRLIEEMAAASVDQARAINEINQGIEQISIVVQTNSATAEQSAAASQEMSAQAAMLNEIVERFRLKD